MELSWVCHKGDPSMYIQLKTSWMWLISTVYAPFVASLEMMRTLILRYGSLNSETSPGPRSYGA